MSSEKPNETTRILLIDDEREFVDTLSERLDLRGFHVTVGYDGEAALAAVDQADPEVVLLDILMPGTGGLAVLEKIKERKPDLPVILISGHGSDDLRRKGMAMGASDCLIKPVEIELLIKKITEIQG